MSTVFLDFDGVLFDNRKANLYISHKATRYVAERVGLPPRSAKLLNEKMYPYYGHTTRMINSLRLTKNDVTISDFNEFVYDEETFDFITNLELTRDDKALYADWSDTLCDDRFGRLFVLSNAPTKWIKVCLSHLNNHTTSAKCILFEDIVSVPEMMDGAMKPCEEAYTYMESMCDGRGIYVEDNATNFKRSSSISNVLLKSAAHVSTANSKTHMIIKEPRELSLGP